MKTVNIFKAGSIYPESRVDGVTINIHEDVEGIVVKSKDPRSNIYQKEGEMLCDALLSALPQGTVDALIAQLLTKRGSSLITPTCKDKPQIDPVPDYPADKFRKTVLEVSDADTFSRKGMISATLYQDILNHYKSAGEVK